MAHQRSWFGGLGFVGVLCVAGVTSTAVATTFDLLPLRALIEHSDTIVVGRVANVEVRTAGPAGQPGLHTVATVRVSETLLGEDVPLRRVWVQGGRLGDRMRVVHGQATFTEGESVVLFLAEAGGGHWPTGMGRGKWTSPLGAPGFAPASPLRGDGVFSEPVSLQDLRRLVREGRRP